MTTEQNVPQTPSRELVEGFDYRTGTKVEQPRRAWRVAIADAITEGGYRRVEDNQTFIKGRDGKLLFEVYDYFPAPARVLA